MRRSAKKKCRLSFESDESEAGRLFELLGPRKFLALQIKFGGSRVWVPKGGRVTRCDGCRWRDRCIRLWHRDGRPVAEIARRIDLSDKSVYRIIGGIRASRR